jgi:hypothetical protein
MRRRIRLLSVLAMTGLTVAACGGGSDTGNASSGTTGSSSQDVAIVSPADGANVTTPFTVKIKTKDPIGPLDSGKNHVHYIIDGKENQYEVVTSTDHVIKSLPAGKHTIKVTLQHADHSPVGPMVQITVNVTGGATSSPSPSSSSTGGGYDYGNGGNGY